MRHIRLFEDINKRLQIGNSVICQEIETSPEYDLRSFLSDNIGRFIRLRSSSDINMSNVPSKYKYIIQYYNIPDELAEGFTFGEPNDFDCRVMCREEIIFYSKNRKDLEYIINANKYNI